MKKIIVLCVLCCFFSACKSPSKGNKNSGSSTYKVYYYESGSSMTPYKTEEYSAGSTITLESKSDVCSDGTIISFKWSDGQNNYTPGSSITLSSDLSLTLTYSSTQCFSGICAENGCECQNSLKSTGESCTADDDCISGKCSLDYNSWAGACE